MRGATENPPAWRVEAAAGSPAVRMFQRPFSFRGRIRHTEYAIKRLIYVRGAGSVDGGAVSDSWG